MDLQEAPAPVAVLLDNHRAFLRYLEHRVGDKALAEDILQDAFVKLVARPDQAPEDEAIVPWFYRTLRNAATDQFRRRGAAGRAYEAFARELETHEQPTVEMTAEICGCVSRLAATLKPEYSFGGFIGGLGTGVWMLRRKRISVIGALSAATPALAVGHAIGRVGCLLVGDDYGSPSNLPWAVAFPEGLPPTLTPVHPTQIYEALALIPLAYLLIRWRRQGRTDVSVLALYLARAGAIRFAIEFLRVNVRVFGGLSVAHLAALAICAVGVGILLSQRASSSTR